MVSVFKIDAEIRNTFLSQFFCTVCDKKLGRSLGMRLLSGPLFVTVVVVVHVLRSQAPGPARSMLLVIK